MLVAVGFLLCGVAANAQRGKLEYAIGVRLGPGTGITGQYFYTDTDVIEAIVYTRFGGFTLTGLYEMHYPAFGVRGLKWFAGGGLHAGSFSYYRNHPVWRDEFDGRRIVVGVDGIIGLEYFFPDIPCQISLDWKPEYQFYGYTGWLADGGAISIRWRI